MICKKCMFNMTDNALFCPSCGSKVSDMQEMEKKTAAVNDVFDMNTPPYSEPVNEAVQPAQTQSSPVQTPVQPFPRPDDRPPFPQPAPVKEKKPKEFFGKGAFVLCLVVIALLAASTGIFAGLYFSLIGAI